MGPLGLTFTRLALCWAWLECAVKDRIPTQTPRQKSPISVPAIGTEELLSPSHSVSPTPTTDSDTRT